LLHQINAPETGCFVGPAAISVAGIGDIKREIFGPVLHVATYRASELGNVVDDINNSGYGLTFGMHSRIDDRIDFVTTRIRAGNVYINRNQIGAIVSSQPFGGEGLSGTGPKAGGPAYVERFTKAETLHPGPVSGITADLDVVQQNINALKVSDVCLSVRAMAGPTGESNRLSVYGRGVFLCLGGRADDALEQAQIVRHNGCIPLIIAPGARGKNAIDGNLARTDLQRLTGFAGVVLWSHPNDQHAARTALAARTGAILPLITERHFAHRCQVERHICIDTTAAGGNATLLAATS